MTLTAPKELYSRFLQGHHGKLHFAAHSHHFWPDVSREAQLAYWDDCAQFSDTKWEKIFAEVLPKTQAHIARMLKLQDREQIAFAPNTHELLSRILSLFLGKKELSILTTSSEFHSWRRQLLRLQELPQLKVSTVDTGNLLNQRRAFIEELKSALQQKPDLFFISQVFFDSGLALGDEELLELCDAKSEQTIMVVDGYHGFGALPCDLSQLEGRIFYLAGGYKYAQAGEGVGFLVIPKGEWRPAFTGWFAEYAELTTAAGKQVGYANNWMAFMGATQDASGFYRFNAVWDQFHKLGWELEQIHSYVKNLQLKFIQALPTNWMQEWQLRPFFSTELAWHGHFLTLEAPDLAQAQWLESRLKQQQILIDRRGQRLRLGFGLYQEAADLEQLLQGLNSVRNQ
jgi:selenocysteine lyase/cysteine desulfurase